ncbi:hypothetical protein Curie_5 [Microbacterium phage Curie]
MPLPDYLASLADLEAYPDTLVADITTEYDTDIGLQTVAIAERDAEITRLNTMVSTLQDVNTQLITAVGVQANDGANENTNNENSNDADPGDIDYDDLLEDE